MGLYGQVVFSFPPHHHHITPHPHTHPIARITPMGGTSMESPTDRMPSLEGTSVGSHCQVTPSWGNFNDKMADRMPPLGGTSASQVIPSQFDYPKLSQNAMSNQPTQKHHATTPQHPHQRTTHKLSPPATAWGIRPNI